MEVGLSKKTPVDGAHPMLRRFVCATCNCRLPANMSKDAIRRNHPGHRLEVKVQPAVPFACSNAQCGRRVNGWMGDTPTCGKCGAPCRLVSQQNADAARQTQTNPFVGRGDQGRVSYMPRG